MAGWYHQCNGHELGKILGYGDREVWYAAVHGVAVRYDLVTEQELFKSNFVAVNLRPFFCMLTWSKYVVYVMSSCWYAVSVCVC